MLLKKIIAYFENTYADILAIKTIRLYIKNFTINILLFLLLFIFYRIELYNIISKFISKIPSQIGFVLLSIPSDLIIIFLLAFIIAFSGLIKNKIITILINICFYQFIISLLTISLEFNNIYEVPFTIQATGDLGSTWFELLYYMIKTINGYIVFRTLLVSIVFYLLITIIFIKFTLAEYNNKYRKKYIKRSFIIFLVIYIFIVVIMKSYLKLSEEISQFFENPMKSTLFTLSKTKSDDLIKYQIKPVKNALNRDSLVSNKIFNRMLINPVRKKYNIIFFIFESTSTPYLNTKLNNKDVTPTWNMLKKNSFWANNHYTNFPLTVNAFFTMYSSVFSLPSDRWIPVDYPDIKVKSLPEILKENGYKTGIFHSGDFRYAGIIRYLKHRKFDFICTYKYLRKNSEKYTKKLIYTVDDRTLVEPVIKFMKNSSKPSFITVVPFSPHYPYEIPEAKYNISKKIITNDKKNQLWYKYLNSLNYADDTLNILVKRLKEEKLLDDSLLIVVADHGEAFYQHRGNVNHPFYLYEENVHVPFLIYNKKLFKKKYAYKGLSCHLDIMPTLLDILKIPFNEYHEGISLLSNHKQKLIPLHTYWKDDYIGLRDENWKYIVRIKDNKEELYNLKNDKKEQINLAKIYPELINKFRIYLKNTRSHKISFFNKVLGKYPPDKNKKNKWIQ